MKEHRTPVLRNSFIVYGAFLTDYSFRLLKLHYLVTGLGPELFGAWGLLGAVITLPLFLHQGLAFALFLRSARTGGSIELGKVLLLVAVFATAIGVPLAGLSSLLAEYFQVPMAFREVVAAGFRLSACIFAVQAFSQLFIHLLQGRGRFDLGGILLVSGSFLTSSGTIVCVHFGYGLVSVLTVELAVATCVLVASAALWRARNADSSPDAKGGDLRSILSATGVQISYSLASKALWELDGLLVPRMFGLQNMASYWLGRRLSYLWGEVQWAGVWPVVPESSRQDETLAARLRSIHLLHTFVAIAAGVFLISYSRDIVVLWVGTGMLGVVIPLRILAAAICIDLLPAVLLSAMFARGRVRTGTLALTAGVALKFILTAVSWYYSSFAGLLLSTACGAALFTALIFRFGATELSIRPLWILSRLSVPFLSTILVVPVLRFFFRSESPYAVAAHLIAYSISCGLVGLVLLRLFFKEDYNPFLRFCLANSTAFWRLYSAIYPPIRRYRLRRQRDPRERIQRFEQIYEARKDPWNFKTSSYEIKKYQEMFQVLGERRFGTAVDIGCSEGVFTRKLASICDRVLGLDISPTALRRARQESADIQNIQFAEYDIVTDPLPANMDFICCGEILNFLPDRKTLLNVRDRIIDSLNSQGWLMIVNLKLLPEDREGVWLGDIAFSAADIHHAFAMDVRLTHLGGADRDMYRISLFERRPQR